MILAQEESSLILESSRLDRTKERREEMMLAQCWYLTLTCCRRLHSQPRSRHWHRTRSRHLSHVIIRSQKASNSGLGSPGRFRNPWSRWCCRWLPRCCSCSHTEGNFTGEILIFWYFNILHWPDTPSVPQWLGQTLACLLIPSRTHIGWRLCLGKIKIKNKFL